MKRIATRSEPASRGRVFGLLLLVVVVAGIAGLVMLANSSEPPQRQVEQTIPDDQLPK